MQDVLVDEEWRSVIGFEGSYEISSHGRVRSVTRRDPNRPGRVLPGRFRKTQIGRFGYHMLNLRKDGKDWPKRVHQMVALVFLGDPPMPIGQGKGTCCVNHKDGNKRNNHFSNLEYCTQQENVIHAWKNGLHPEERRGAGNGRAVLTEDIVRLIRKRYAAGGISMNAMAREYGVSPETVGFVVRRVTWTHITD